MLPSRVQRGRRSRRQFADADSVKDVDAIEWHPPLVIAVDCRGLAKDKSQSRVHT